MESLETSKVRERVLPYLWGKGIDVGCSRDPITPDCIAFDRPEFSHYPEVNCVGDAQALPFEKETFDWLWSSHCLEDFEDTGATVTEWLRVIKGGGIVGLYVPHPNYYFPNNTEHKHPGFTVQEISGLLQTRGCEILMTKLDNEGLGRYSSLAIARKR